MGLEKDSLRDFAYYYSEWIWPTASSDWMKSQLLFFEGIALALPANLAQSVIEQDPILAQPLQDKGLLVNLEPAKWLDRESAELLATTLINFVEQESGFFYFDDLMSSGLTVEHWGGSVAPEAASVFSELLYDKGLAGRVSDSGLVVISSYAKLLVLTVFLRILAVCVSRSSNISLQPVAHGEIVSAWLRAHEHYLGGLGLRSITRDRFTRIIHDDLAAVVPDLSIVPLDEILDFRREHGHHYRAYVRSLRQFFLNSTTLSDAEFEEATRIRSEEVAEALADLRRLSRISFGRPAAGFALALAGSVWTGVHGDPIGATLSALVAAAAVQTPKVPASDYSYFLRVVTM
jgi:hypothetical protein